MSVNAQSQGHAVMFQNSCIKRFAPVVSAIQLLETDTKKDNILIAIDGRCASGKTTLGAYLETVFDINLFHMDDFFLQKHQRTKERLEEPGGNVDYERFFEEILKPLREGRKVEYCRFDCGTMELGERRSIPWKRVNVIEGSYSHHPYFGEVYDLKIFSDIDSEDQLNNIENRNGSKMLEVFKERWIPKEEAYFETFGIRKNSDILVEWIKK